MVHTTRNVLTMTAAGVLASVIMLASAAPALAHDAAPASRLSAVAAASANPPLVACSAEQIRATQRWWFFGNRAVMDFGTTGTTVAFTQNASSIDAVEGTTVVTDTTGQLLFYSNGQSVWNRNHVVMQNGSGLIAAPSATQTVAAFPSLSRPGVYFVVSNGGAYESGGVGPLRYSEVDLSLDGGLGAVTGVKNVLLDGGANTATEGLTAVPNADGSGFWVITATGGSETRNHDIVAHEFDGDGPTGTIVRSAMSTANGNGFGTFNLSEDLSTIVQITGTGTSGEAGQLRLLDLDAATGAITERVTWSTASGAGNGNYAYSADFSPDGRWVYATRIFGTGQLFRYDIETHTTAVDLQNNVERITSLGTNGGAVKRGPDGRIYVASYNGVVTVVDNPDAVTDLEYSTLTSPSGVGIRFGLPQTATGCPTPQNAPTGLGAVAAGYDAIDLAWTEPADTGGDTLVGYRIERSLDGTTWTLVVADTGDTGTTYHDTGLDPGTEYHYRVFAVYDSGPSDSSNTSRATTDDEAPSCTTDNVNCFPSAVSGDDVILEVDPACEIESSEVTAAGDLSDADPDGFEYPLGLLQFTLDCGAVGFTTDVVQYYFDAEDRGFLVRKYRPLTGAYFTVGDADIQQVVINGRDALKVTFEITDGGALDMDGVADGRIEDPAGLALSGIGAPRTGPVPHDIGGYLLSLLVGVGLLGAAVAGALRRGAGASGVARAAETANRRSA